MCIYFQKQKWNPCNLELTFPSKNAFDAFDKGLKGSIRLQLRRLQSCEAAVPLPAVAARSRPACECLYARHTVDRSHTHVDITKFH